MILKPTRIIENKDHLLEMAGLYLELKTLFTDKYPDADPEDRKWALEQSIMRLPVKDGHDYGAVV